MNAGFENLPFKIASPNKTLARRKEENLKEKMMNTEETTAAAWKQDLRSRMKEIRDSIPPADRKTQEEQILSMLTATDLYKGAASILTYVSFGSEVGTDSFIRKALADQKKVYVPKVIDDHMEFFRIEDLKDLKKGYRGIREPEADPVRVFPYDLHYSLESAQKCLFVMPGLAFDKSCARLGFGGGYYDRFMSHFHKKMSVALAFREQIVDKVPTESTDFCPDVVLTPDEAFINV